MRTSPRRSLLATTATVALAVPMFASTAGATEGGRGHHPPRVGTSMAPIGGGYETPSLEGFARLAARGASGTTVDLVVVPSAYGDAPEDRAENLELAQERTDQVDAACDAVVRAPRTGCTARLAVLLDRADALDPANSTGLASADGIYVLGGDQGLAMQVLAGSPAEVAMGRAAASGATIGGTSAGAAVQSRSMINGYVGDLGPADGLRRDSTLVWWGDDGDLERGLAFGSRAAIYDQHFHQRGRMGRLLSTLATSDEHFKGRSPVGLGVDYATGIHNDGDRVLSGVFGGGSVSLLDLETLGSTHRWVGPDHVLSARNVLTHLLVPGDTTYALATRTLRVDGAVVRAPRRTPWAAPRTPGAGSFFLGGDLLAGDSGTAALRAFVAASRPRHQGTQGRLVVVSASAGDTATATRYAAALRAAGWSGRLDAVAYGTPQWSRLSLDTATGVVVTAADATTLGTAMGDRVFRERVTRAARTAPAFLADDHFAAATGHWWSPKADPTDDTLEDEGIASFRSDDARWQRGLGLVSANVVPSLTGEYRWGRLYGAAQVDRRTPALGVADGTMLALTRRGAQVVGGSSVVALDGRGSVFTTGSNGAIGATNVVVDVFAVGERVGSKR